MCSGAGGAGHYGVQHGVLWEVDIMKNIETIRERAEVQWGSWVAWYGRLVCSSV